MEKAWRCTRPVGSIVDGLHGSLKVTAVFGSKESTPVVLLRSSVTKPEDLVLLSYVPANRNGCVVCATVSGTAFGSIE